MGFCNEILSIWPSSCLHTLLCWGQNHHERQDHPYRRISSVEAQRICKFCRFQNPADICRISLFICTREDAILQALKLWLYSIPLTKRSGCKLSFCVFIFSDVSAIERQWLVILLVESLMMGSSSVSSKSCWDWRPCKLGALGHAPSNSVVASWEQVFFYQD